MARSDEAAAFFAAVYETVQIVPHGRVTTYGHIAKLIGRPIIAECPRQVGTCLKHLPDQAQNVPFHNGNVPWQRVINAKGTISQRGGTGALRQSQALEAEGVTVGRGSLGEYTIDMTEYGWFPDEVDIE